MNPEVGIFCRTYDKDANWLLEAVPTWLRDCRGYDGLVITDIPEQCRQVRNACSLMGIHFQPDEESALIPNGYINQQYTKMRADLFLDSEYILFVDSDTLSYGRHQPDIWFKDGKPMLLYSTWEHVGPGVPWKAPTEKILQLEAPYEFMRKLPQVYHRDVVKGCREHIETVHGKTLLEVLQSEPTVSEFNLLGCWAWHKAHDYFTWVHPETEGVPPNPFKQFWSHGDMLKQIRSGISE